MKSNWTPGRVQWRWLREAHPVTIWTLWTVTIALLCLWILGIATGHAFGGRIHLLAAAAVLTGAFCTYQTFRYGAFLERPAKGGSAQQSNTWRFRRRG
ncbi:MAG: hypothetical protein K0Q91_1866 [Fibrobacteria bacterium]|jgi:hypothetical protein|nr:hypothetical protein [Fibrobacteria bacterium]